MPRTELPAAPPTAGPPEALDPPPSAAHEPILGAALALTAVPFALWAQTRAGFTGLGLWSYVLMPLLTAALGYAAAPLLSLASSAGTAREHRPLPPLWVGATYAGSVALLVGVLTAYPLGGTVGLLAGLFTGAIFLLLLRLLPRVRWAMAVAWCVAAGLPFVGVL